MDRTHSVLGILLEARDRALKETNWVPAFMSFLDRGEDKRETGKWPLQTAISITKEELRGRLTEETQVQGSRKASQRKEHLS